MRPETEEKVKRAVELVRQGSTKKSAIESVGLSPAGVYSKAINEMLGAKQTKALKQKRPTFIDLPLKKESSNVAIIVCQPDQVKAVLDGLQ